VQNAELSAADVHGFAFIARILRAARSTVLCRKRSSVRCFALLIAETCLMYSMSINVYFIIKLFVKISTNLYLSDEAR
jgi:hypothetical protein